MAQTWQEWNMIGKHFCPNCDATMGEGDPCPECEHRDGDEGCECQYCEDVRTARKDFEHE